MDQMYRITGTIFSKVTGKLLACPLFRQIHLEKEQVTKQKHNSLLVYPDGIFVNLYYNDDSYKWMIATKHAVNAGILVMLEQKNLLTILLQLHAVKLVNGELTPNFKHKKERSYSLLISSPMIFPWIPVEREIVVMMSIASRKTMEYSIPKNKSTTGKLTGLIDHNLAFMASKQINEHFGIVKTGSNPRIYASVSEYGSLVNHFKKL
jgi:hypothetical protein